MKPKRGYPHTSQANLDIFINRNRVVFSFTDDEETISPEVKPEVVTFVKSKLSERNTLFDEREAIDRRQNPDAYKAWIKKYQAWGEEINETVKKLQFG